MPTVTGTFNRWTAKDWVAEGRHIRERGWCRSYTDFLFQIRIGRETSKQWRRKHSEWKTLCEGFPTRSKPAEIRCLNQYSLWRFEKLLPQYRRKGATEGEAQWLAADQTLREFRAANLAKSKSKPRASKGRGRVRAMTRRTAQEIFGDFKRWAAIRTLCDCFGLTVAEALRECFGNEHAITYYMTARREYEKVRAGIGAGNGWEHLIKRYWRDWEGVAAVPLK